MVQNYSAFRFLSKTDKKVDFLTLGSVGQDRVYGLISSAGLQENIGAHYIHMKLLKAQIIYLEFGLI